MELTIYQRLIGMDNNRLYYAAMVLYGDPAARLQIPAISE
jgi:hypothetical protein